MQLTEILELYTYWLCKEGKDECLGYKGNNEKFVQEFLGSEEFKKVLIESKEI